MILVDTAIWIDHFRDTDLALKNLLDKGQVLSHPFVIGELAIGNLKPRVPILSDLRDLSLVTMATDDEVLTFIDQHKLFGLGIGYIDAHLLISVQLTYDTLLWTRDKRLNTAAERLGLAARQPSRNTIH